MFRFDKSVLSTSWWRIMTVGFERIFLDWLTDSFKSITFWLSKREFVSRFPRNRCEIDHFEFHQFFYAFVCFLWEELESNWKAIVRCDKHLEDDFVWWINIRIFMLYSLQVFLLLEFLFCFSLVFLLFFALLLVEFTGFWLFSSLFDAQVAQLLFWAKRPQSRLTPFRIGLVDNWTKCPHSKSFLCC